MVRAALLHEIVDAASDKCSPRSLSRSPLVGSWKLHLELADDCERMMGHSDAIHMPD